MTPKGGAPHDDNLHQHYRDPVFELGGDVTRPLAEGALKLVALATRRKRHDFDQYVQRAGLIEDDAPVDGGFEQLVDARRNETIGRLSWTRSDLLGFSFEAGAEAALNTLDDHVAYSEIDEHGNAVPIPLPIADARVKETRGETYVNVGKTLSPRLRIDGGLNFEFSHLIVTGDASEDRRLKFLKPSLSLDWNSGTGWHAQLSARRKVAQLDFYDFISVADLSAQRVNGGNAQLQPQRTWELRATVDHPLLGDGLFKLDLGHDQVSLLQDRILHFRRRVEEVLRCAWQSRDRHPRLRPADPRSAAVAPVERPQDQGQRNAPAYPSRGSDQSRASQMERFLPDLAVEPRCPPRFRQMVLRLRGLRQPAIHLLPNRRVRHQLQRQPLLDRVRRIPPVGEYRDHARRRQCV